MQAVTRKNPLTVRDVDGEFTKVVRIGKVRYYNKIASTYCSINFHGGRLSIVGVEGPTGDGNCIGSCGQINLDAREIVEYAPGWTAELVATFRDVWKRWHLNDMRAGSAVQEQWLRAHPLDPRSYAHPKSHFEVAREALRAAGLQPDPDGYSYGSAWKFEAVPAGVLDFLRSLPDTDQNPAWI